MPPVQNQPENGPQLEKKRFRLKRIIALISSVIAIAVSLLWFPQSLPLLAALWLCVAAIFFCCLEIKPVRLASVLAFIAGLFLLKQVPLTTITSLFLVIFGGSSLYLVCYTKSVTRVVLGFVLLICSSMTLLMWFDWYRTTNPTHTYSLDQNRPIACLGDSLTAAGYPKLLSEKLTVDVLNYGFDGITSNDALEMLPSLIDKNPQLVVIEIGGHDYNQRKSRKQTKATIEEIIKRLHQANIEVVLVEIPRGFITDPFRGLERELARKYDLQLVPDSVIRRFVLFSPIMPPGMWLPTHQHLSNDGLHPNERGNEAFAKAVTLALVKTYGDTIVNSSH